MADTTTITGTVYKVSDIELVSEKFSKREIIIKTEGEYPQFIPVQFANKNIDKLDHIIEGQSVTVSYNFRGRLWNDKQGVEKCFVNIEGWQIKNNSSVSSTPKEEFNKSANQVSQEDDFNNLPF